MCGIAGIAYQDFQKSADPALLKRMGDAMAHRGPDDEGFYARDHVGLAHRRLSIIDLSGGHQPILSADQDLAIVFNGEIYNHEQLRAELSKEEPYAYSTRSDTETILHAYRVHGRDCVKHLRGMFAFCIYDRKKKLLFIARDRMGKKPLYFYHAGGVFLFASEAKAILGTGLVPRKVNKRMIDFYLSIGYVPGKESLFEGIYKLEPGHTLTLDENHKAEVREYWDIRCDEKSDLSYEEAKKTLKEKLLESVRIRLMSEVPLGVFLSGGLDSSAVVALMSELGVKPIKTFSVGYKDQPESSELNYAKIVADRFKTEHHEFFLSPDGLFDSIDSFLDHCDEPLVESAGIALFKLAQLAKPRATVLLSGEGADEILAGYPIYAKMRTLERMHGVARFAPAALAGWLRNGHSEKIVKYLEWIGLPFEQRYRSLSYDLCGSIKKRMYTPEFRRELPGDFDLYFLGLHAKAARAPSLLGKMSYIDIKSWLAEDILLKSDRMTMAASIELRAPFLDHELAEFALSLPVEYRLRGGNGKRILKEVMEPMLPREILYRAKRGFPVPLTAWFRGELKDRARALLLDERAMARGYFNRAYMEGLFEKIASGEDLGRRIFSLVVLELWHRKQVD